MERTPPTNRADDAFRRILEAVVDEEGLRQIAASVARKAKRGDVAAARLVLERLLGQPTLPILVLRDAQVSRRPALRVYRQPAA